MVAANSPSAAQRQWFGILFAIFNFVFAVVMVRPWGVDPFFYWAWFVAVAGLVGIYYLVPRLQPKMFRGWVALTYPIGWLITNLLLAVVFCGCIVPIGIVIKIVGYDPLNRRLSRQDRSYWEERRNHEDPGRYFKQY